MKKENLLINLAVGAAVAIGGIILHNRLLSYLDFLQFEHDFMINEVREAELANLETLEKRVSKLEALSNSPSTSVLDYVNRNNKER